MIGRKKSTRHIPGLAEIVSANAACTGGPADARTESVTMIYVQGKILTIRRIRGNRREMVGVTGISLESRRTGAGAEHFILPVNVTTT